MRKYLTYKHKELSKIVLSYVHTTEPRLLLMLYKKKKKYENMYINW